VATARWRISPFRPSSGGDDKVIAAVCHGPAALLSATRPDGTWAFAGRNLAGFTNDEEAQAGLAERAQWLLEDRMRDAGGNLDSGPAWEPFSVVDDNIVTGQNPPSSTEVAQRTVERQHPRCGRRPLTTGEADPPSSSTRELSTAPHGAGDALRRRRLVRAAAITWPGTRARAFSQRVWKVDARQHRRSSRRALPRRSKVLEMWTSGSGSARIGEPLP
jgi:hypothetical protein